MKNNFQSDLLYRHVTNYFLPQINDKTLVYHYTSPTGLKNILNTKELWASDFLFLNDESEILYLYEILKSVIKNYKVEQNLDKNFIREVNTILDAPLEHALHGDYTYICSLSLNSDSLPLWNYYTKTATGIGYNICFDWGTLLEKFDSSQMKCGKVIYNQDEQIHLLELATIGYNSTYMTASSETEKMQAIFGLKDALNILSLYLKHPGFANEEEVRICIIQKRDPMIPRKACYREVNGIFVPYTTVKFSETAVKGIGISPVNQKSLSEIGISSMLLDFGYTNVSVQVSKIPLRN